MLLEICANSFQSAKNAQTAGAQRIELCQELTVGGLTPSYGLLKKVIAELTIPVFVLIRPRSGDFVYAEPEFDIMKQDISLCKELGVQGIVSGVLNKNKTIDVVRTKELLERSRPLSFTFHRAFDELDNPVLGLNQLIELGVDRVLTSGQESSAVDVLPLLMQFNEIARGRLTILPGGGINAKNAAVFKTKGFTEIHASASVQISQDQGLFSAPQTVSDLKTIKAIRDAL
ncbi:copper homeostasis protein CutC [uncultured Winogradskyella sp.]|uniref:copper homeostasis protein CutC n=1 Tax=uncultured Winogradskyella sp. TaxID=395353 RepID=UPI003518A5B1